MKMVVWCGCGPDSFTIHSFLGLSILSFVVANCKKQKFPSCNHHSVVESHPAPVAAMLRREREKGNCPNLRRQRQRMPVRTTSTARHAEIKILPPTRKGKHVESFRSRHRPRRWAAACWQRRPSPCGTARAESRRPGRWGEPERGQRRIPGVVVSGWMHDKVGDNIAG